ncbi:MAG: bifunctional rhamnulose-1-phosphate aldolase/short-chain dehydrogenase [Chloroflexi bacterium]|nr:bifunctional rhamnulose-1-phosphate aldolase/short-chain dehydrogenase [Chloroflexota bacterium]
MLNRWSQTDAQGLSDLEMLAYQSRLVGADPALVVWGGGNTSLKVSRRDFRGHEVRAMLIKGSGSDMKAAQQKDFPAVRLEDLLPLFERGEMSDEEMVAYMERCLLDPGSPRPSIETLLHAFLPQASVVHSHADAILSLTNTSNPTGMVRAALGGDIVVTPYLRPGFLLSKRVAQAALSRPKAKGVVLLNHGLVTWGADPKASYDTHIELVRKAEEFIQQRAVGKLPFGGVKVEPLSREERRRVAATVTPGLRSALSAAGESRTLLRFVEDDQVLRFTGSKEGREVAKAGAATPDHLLNTKRVPLWVEVEEPSHEAELRDALEQDAERYRQEYTQWFREHAVPGLGMRDPSPRIITVPGLGLWVGGRDARAIEAASDIYHHTIAIMAGAQSVDVYSSLTMKDAFEAEYWPLELYKLTLLPPEAELARKVAFVTGAARGIGRAVALRLVQAGAHVALADLDAEGAKDAAAQVCNEAGAGRCIALPLDVASPEQVAAAFQETVLAFGGVDILVSNAGIAPSGTLDQLSLAQWQKSLDVNATGHLLVGQEAVRIMREQGLGGSLVFIATKNVLAPGRGFGAYSAAKAAEAQLARVFALENGAYGIRSNIVNPDAVFHDSGLWSQELREERARAHGVPVEALEDFYRQRNLLQAFVTPRDVAEAVLWLAGDRSAKTTGCIITVDGGVPEAFPRE